MRRITTLTSAGILVWLSASAALAQCENTCIAAVDGPRQGVHSRFDGTADVVVWPPNHKFATVRISGINEDGDACDVTITDVRQDEEVNGLGDGNTDVDARDCDNAGNDSTIDVRGERSGMGTGRYYHIFYDMDDPDCPLMPASGDARALVPHDQGMAHVNTWVDEGPLFASYEGLMLSCTE